jgi:hypothetical protein
MSGRGASGRDALRRVLDSKPKAKVKLGPTGASGRRDPACPEIERAPGGLRSKKCPGGTCLTVARHAVPGTAVPPNQYRQLKLERVFGLASQRTAGGNQPQTVACSKSPSFLTLIRQMCERDPMSEVSCEHNVVCTIEGTVSVRC